MKSPYNKPHLSIPDQLRLLEARGMTVDERARAERYLRRLGYYRRSGYWYPARQANYTIVDNQPVRTVTDTFQPGTTFERAVDLYVFDKRLRLLFLDALERIEVSLRVEAALLLSARDPIAHRNPNHLHGNFSKKVDPQTCMTHHARWLQRLDDNAAHSKEEFVERFQQKYSTPLPMWIAIELWDFGLLSRFIGGMQFADRATLAATYSIPRQDLLQSWVRNLNQVRNVCAHHSRLWNRVSVDYPKPPKPGDVPLLDHLAAAHFPLGRIYTTAAITQHFMRVVSPRSTWGTRFKDLIATFPTGPGIVLGHAGFPPDWDKLPLWS